jgi:alkylation response protein AidB-like acyl-CoA dehydrogenase
MDFDLSEEQRLLADSVRRMLGASYGFEARKAIVDSAAGCSPEAWRALAELGLLALPLPTEYDGFGGGAVDLAPAMEAFGEALLVEPFLATVACARLVARGGSDELRREMLATVGSGEMKLALAQTEDGARYDVEHVASTARREGDDYVLDGEKRVVLHAPQAQRMLVSARTSGAVRDASGISLFVVDASAAGVAMRPYRTLDSLRGADVSLRGVRVPASRRVGAEGEAFDLLDEAIDFATALTCTEAVGAMRFANDTTLEYLKTRKQFGVPIGSFQALQHRMVDMVISAEQARSMAGLACAAIDRGVPAAERRAIVSAAKIRVADACRHVSQESVQLHGGMGMTEELKVSHTFRRLTMISQQFGDADHHLARFAAAAATG